MHTEQIITTTRTAWGLPKPEKTPSVDGVNAGCTGSREVSSEGVGYGQSGGLCGDLCGRERHARQGRSGRWAGQGLGVRPPMTGETPLSRAEVEHGFERDIIDPLPTRRVVKQVGEWELANVRLMARASFFDGLMA